MTAVVLKNTVAGLDEKALARFTARAAAAVKLRGSVNVLVTTSSELRNLNRRFRRKDQATDVLSFPAEARARGELAGDIAISADIARANGKKLGHSAGDEVKILVLHGMLHLAGYNHERDNGVMARKEARLREALKLPAGLLERQEVSTGGRAKRQPRVRGNKT